jgi:hypothetical protein
MKRITSLLLLSIVAVSAQTRDYPKTPKDKFVHAEGAGQVTDVESAIQPYVAKARRTYPAARKRFLAGLPPKYLFSVTTKLWDRSHTKFEVVFVVADQIDKGTVTGRLATHTKQPVGYNFGDQISFPESHVMDWTIVHPYGTEEGNVVGKFMDTYRPR